MFVVLKPEMKRCLRKLEPYLGKADFEVTSRHPIKQWPKIARKLYSLQADVDPYFESELNAYLWLTQSIFGDDAVVFRVHRQGSLRRNLERLAELKEKFRVDISPDLAPINFLINLDQIPLPSNGVKLGKNGSLKVDDTPIGKERTQGRWDYFFFKYIHTSDPDPDIFREEDRVLREEGIYNAQIDEREWELMKRLNTLTHTNEKL